MLGEGFTLYFDVIREQSPYYPQETASYFHDEVSKLIDEERRNQFNDKTIHHESTYTFIICYHQHQENIQKLENWLFDNKQDALNLNSIVNVFKNTIDEFTSFLSHSMQITPMMHIETENYINSGLVNYLHQTLTNEKVNFNLQKPAVDLDMHIGCRDLDLRSLAKIGNQYIQTLSISKFPQEMSANILSGLDMLGISYRWNTRFTFLEKYKSEQFLHKYYKSWDEKVHSWKSTIVHKAEFIGDRADEHALDMSEDSNTALNEARSKVVSLWYMHSQHHINA